MNANELLKKVLEPTGLPVDADINRNGDDEYITFTYTGEDFENFSDNLPENDYTSLQVHYFTKGNPHETKKTIAELLFCAGFDVAIGMTDYEEDTKYNHTVFDVGIDGVLDFTESEE